MILPYQYIFQDNGIYPNSFLPVLHYPGAFELSWLLPSAFVKKVFIKHGWTNHWRSGIYTCNHYHSTSHEVLGVIRGKASILFGGENGKTVVLQKGDVVVIPAGVAHKNLSKQHDLICIGAYPGGRSFDMNYGRTGERPKADENIAKLPVPDSDPVYGKDGPLKALWENAGL